MVHGFFVESPLTHQLIGKLALRLHNPFSSKLRKAN